MDETSFQLTEAQEHGFQEVLAEIRHDHREVEDHAEVEAFTQNIHDDGEDG